MSTTLTPIESAAQSAQAILGLSWLRVVPARGNRSSDCVALDDSELGVSVVVEANGATPDGDSLYSLTVNEEGQSPLRVRQRYLKCEAIQRAARMLSEKRISLISNH